MFVLPNAFTVSSIFCGFYAMVSLSADITPRRLYESAIAIFFGIFFDMADGRVARMTRTQALSVCSSILVDVITFGAAPAVVLYKWALGSLGLVGMFAGFAYASCGALRLARFNVLAARSPGSMKFFVGLPIPLAAGVMMSLVMFHQRRYGGAPEHPLWVMAATFAIAYLMVSNIRYRTFKDVKVSALSLSIFGTLIAAFVVIAVLVHPTFALGWHRLQLRGVWALRRSSSRKAAVAITPKPAAAAAERSESSRMKANELAAGVRRLSEHDSAPFEEIPTRAALHQWLDELKLGYEVDAYGNTLVRVRRGMPRRTIALIAHLDHPGLRVDTVDAAGVITCVGEGGLPLKSLKGRESSFRVPKRVSFMALSLQ